MFRESFFGLKCSARTLPGLKCSTSQKRLGTTALELDPICYVPTPAKLVKGTHKMAGQDNLKYF